MRIWLSSAENYKGKDVLLNVPVKKNLLVSYYYMRSRSDEAVKTLLDNFINQGNTLMLDSVERILF